MPANPSTTTRVAIFGLVSVAAMAGVVLQPWIDLNSLGGDVTWNGLGMPAGEGALVEHYDTLAGIRMTKALGWIALVAVIAAAAALIASTKRLPWLVYVSIALSAVAVVAVAIPAVEPSVIAGQLLYEVGAHDVDPALAVRASALWTGVVVSALMLAYAVLIVVLRRRLRRA